VLLLCPLLLYFAANGSAVAFAWASHEFLTAFLAGVVVLQTNRAYGGRPFLYGSGEAGETLTISGLDRRSARGVPYPATVDAMVKIFRTAFSRTPTGTCIPAQQHAAAGQL
jgi:hypothetical protein